MLLTLGQEGTTQPDRLALLAALATDNLEMHPGSGSVALIESTINTSMRHTKVSVSGYSTGRSDLIWVTFFGFGGHCHFFFEVFPQVLHKSSKALGHALQFIPTEQSAPVL